MEINNMTLSRETVGIILGLAFCLLSGAFDVSVANLSQSLNPMLIGLYCFLTSTLLFGLSKLISDRHNLQQKFKANLELVGMLNLSVLMTWAGLFYALKFLEPAVVGIVSVAIGPALTLFIGLFIGTNKNVAKYDIIISGLVLLAVFITLSNSFFGYSGLNNTNTIDRILGIVSVVICAIGTVSYALTSQALGKKGWHSTELLAVRNILMVLVSFAMIYINKIPLSLGHEFMTPMLLVVIFGHIIPIYMIQKTIMMVSALQISFILLSLPVFTLLLQYFDDRVAFSPLTIISTMLILILMATSLTMKFYRQTMDLT